MTPTFGSGAKVSVVVQFIVMNPKIIDPRLAPIDTVN